MTDELEEMAREILKRPELVNPKKEYEQRLFEITNALRTLRSKTRKEDAEKIKELRERIKRVEENAVGMLTAPCIECENLKRELNSPIRLIAQEVSMKEEWRNRAVKHAEEILLLKERLSFFVELIKEALKMGYCSIGWDKKAKAILKKDEEERK